MKSAIEAWAVRAKGTRPDSPAARRVARAALEQVLQAGHPVYQDVRAQLASLAAVEELDARLQAYLPEPRVHKGEYL